MRFSRSLLVGVALSLVAAACGDDEGDAGADSPTSTTTPAATEAPAEETTTTAAVPKIPTPVARDCDVDAEIASSAECWWIAVPVDHDDGAGPTYDLAVTVLRAPIDDPGTPLVHVSGGPGDPGGNPNVWGSGPFIEDRDVIVWDQRGTGDSDPDTQCPEIEAVALTTLEAAAPFAAEIVARDVAAVECHDRLTDAGVDLDSFFTTASAHDLEVIRQALGYDRWQIFGVSYGSRLTLETMRQHPGGIEAVILDSVYPTSAGTADELAVAADRVFVAFADACAASPSCSTEHPDLAADLLVVFDTYNRVPIELSLEIEGTVHDLILTGDDVAAGLFNALYDTSLIPSLPDAVGSFLDGDTALASMIAQGAIASVNGAAEAMAIATSCADNNARAGADDWAAEIADVGRYGTLQTFNPRSACPAFPVTAQPAAFGEPVVSDIPTLVAAGSLDPVTPPAANAETAANLVNATYVEFAPVGHGAVLATECGTAIARDFLAATTEPVDTTCADAMAGPFG